MGSTLRPSLLRVTESLNARYKCSDRGQHEQGLRFSIVGRHPFAKGQVGTIGVNYEIT